MTPPKTAVPEPPVYTIPEATHRLQSFCAARDNARDELDRRQDELIEAGKDARRSGVSVSRIAEVIGLSRQQAHRLFGAEPKAE